MRSKIRIGSLVLLSLIYSIVMVGCTQNQSNKKNEGEISVAVSIVPEKTFIKAVGGDLIHVVTLIPPGASPETYTPTPQQMQKFAKASLYFAIGVPSEEASILPKAKEWNKDLKIIDLAQEVAKKYPDRFFNEEDQDHEKDQKEEAHHHSGRDPHIWLSPKRVKVMIEVMIAELSTLDPEHKEIYAKNGKNYIQQLDQVDQEIRATIENVPNKTFISFHPSFGYFADEYGFNMITIEKEGKEATADHMQEVVDIAREKNIHIIFNQAEFDSKQAEAIAEEIQGQVRTLEPLAPDYIENLREMTGVFSK